jgi:hypothetical protein
MPGAGSGDRECDAGTGGNNEEGNDGHGNGDANPSAADDPVAAVSAAATPANHVNLGAVRALVEASECAFKSVEVKGQRDSLADKQRAWLAVLACEGGMDVEICHVLEPKEGKKGGVKGGTKGGSGEKRTREGGKENRKGKTGAGGVKRAGAGEAIVLE